MEGDQTIISKPPDHRGNRDMDDVKAFTFDKSYWSADKSDPTFADQNTVYNDLGEDLLNHAFDGYNCCIFACKFLLIHIIILLLIKSKMVKLVLVNLIP